MNIVVSDPKSGRAINKKTDEAVFLNRKIGDEVDLHAIGLSGFRGKITGGSDRQGFPMKKSLQGSGRKKLLLKAGIGFNASRDGEKRRKSVRGNTVSPETMQLNISITKHGDRDLKEFFKPAEAGKKEEAKKSAKERMIKASLEAVGDLELADEAKKIKGKVRR
jgi:small subunit ribosomal protein S6e